MAYINTNNNRYSFNTSLKFPEPVFYSAETSSAHGIWGYSHKPSPVFHGTQSPDQSNTMGVENEVECYGDVDRYDLARYLHSKHGDHVYCKSDGSLSDGVEIVSHPATLAYHMRKHGWADILNAANKAGAKSHDTTTCGLHVHVGRAGLGQTEEARELCIAKMMLVFDKFYENELFKFSRRRSLAEMSRWASKNNAGILPTDKRPEVVRKSRENSARYERYHAINLTNSNTVEFRIFKGTLNMETFAATLQFVDTLVKYCKTHTLPEVQACTFAEIVDGCKYPELKSYCRRRGIAVND